MISEHKQAQLEAEKAQKDADALAKAQQSVPNAPKNGVVSDEKQAQA